MKYYGDIPKSHRILINELESLEKWFKKHGDTLPLLSAAKGYVCMAHDWYSMDIEEEGERCLKAADAICPGYFKAPILSQAKRDADFAYLLSRLEYGLGLDVLLSLGYDLNKQI